MHDCFLTGAPPAHATLYSNGMDGTTRDTIFVDGTYNRSTSDPQPDVK
jgi:hypothetical protein